MISTRFVCFALTLTSFTLGCAPKDEREKVVNIPQNTWGMEFKTTPISQASAQEQELARAVAFVRFAEGGSGTGFFISPDGLFLTNEHVIPRERCGKDRCAGIQIIRDFEPNGDFQVFNRFTVIAQNEELDFALLRVELPAGTRVPFLNLGSGSVDLEDRKLSIIGHPFGASLRVSSATYDDTDGSRILLKSVAISGNSGSPLIDLSSGTVVGLYHAGFWDKNSVRKSDGAVKHFGEAIDIGKIRKVLGQLFKNTENSSELGATQFETPVSPARVRDVLPRDRATMLNAAHSSMDRFIGQALATSEAQSQLETLLNEVSGTVRQADDYRAIISGLVNAGRARGERTILPKNLADRLLNGLTDDNSSSLMFRVDQGMVLVADCVTTIDATLGGDHPRIPVLYKLGQICQASHDRGFRSVLSGLDAYFQGDDDYAQYQGMLAYAPVIIESQARLGMIFPDRLASVLRILEIVAANAEQMNVAFKAEQLHALLQHDRKLLDSGAFRATF